MDMTCLKNYIKEIKLIMNQNKDYLIELDSVVGDGDLGLTMADGFAAAYEAIRDKEEPDVGKLLYAAGKTMGNAVPSTMGTLMAAGLMNAGKMLKGKTELAKEDWVILFRGYMDGVSALGKAKVGEKTFLDGIAPAVAAMEKSVASGKDILEAAKKAEEAAKEGVKNTATMKAMHGRAAIRGEASRELTDPGASVAALLFEAFTKSISS